MKKIVSFVRSGLFMLRFYLYVLFVLVPPLPYYKYLTKKGETDKRTKLVFKAIHKWANYCVKIGKSSVTVRGIEKIPKDKNVLFISNHQSYADIPMLIYALKDFNFGFVLKSTLINIPFIGDYLKYMNCVTVDQTDIRQSATALSAAADIIKQGNSLLIFPEGKRSFSNIPDEFKNGAFKIVQKTGVTVVPVCLNNVHLVYEGNERLIAPANVTITVLDPVETTNLGRKDMDSLKAQIYKTIFECNNSE